MDAIYNHDFIQLVYMIVHVGLVQVKYTFPHLESVVFSSIE